MKNTTNVRTASVVSSPMIDKTTVVSWFDPLRILGKTYKISVMPDHTPDEEFGACSYAYQLIEYNGKLALDERKDTIIHEMVHCLDHALQTKMSEEQVHAISSGFYAIIKDNPDFFRWVVADQPEVLDNV